MTTESKKPLKLFYCYAREDKALRDELDIYLCSLTRQNLVTSWYDGEISPGSDWEKEIDIQLSAAHLILLLVTPHFIASDYCYTQMERALKRRQDGTALVIPIILRRTLWEDAPFSSLQVLPADAKPVAQCVDRDEAFWNITVGIRKAITDLRITLKTKRDWLDEGYTLRNLKRYDEAIAAFDQTIHLDPNDAIAYGYKGHILCELKRYDEAIAAFDQIIRLHPKIGMAYLGKGNALYDLKRYDEAIDAFDQIIDLNPSDTSAYNNKGNALRKLKLYKEAIVAYDQAIRLDPNLAMAYNNKALAFDQLGKLDDAKQCREKARQLESQGQA